MANDRRCLFCLGNEDTFASREHIFPETVGNTELAMLRPGIICDRCNNGPLARLDEALCDYLPIAVRRATLGIPNKKGTAATVSFAEGRIEPLPAEAVASSDSHGVRLVDQNPRRPITHSFEGHDDHVAFKISGQSGRRLTERYLAELSRAVLKIAVECAYLDHREKVFASRFEHVRGVVLGQRDHHGEIAWLSTATAKTCGCSARTCSTTQPESAVPSSTSSAWEWSHTQPINGSHRLPDSSSDGSDGRQYPACEPRPDPAGRCGRALGGTGVQQRQGCWSFSRIALLREGESFAGRPSI